MSETADSISIRLDGNTDAQVWAQEFAKVVRGRLEFLDDEGFLIGWFANAITAGEQKGAKNTQQSVKDEHERGISALGFVTAELAHESKAWKGEAPDWFPSPPEFLELWEEGYVLSLAGIEDDGA